MIGLPNVAGRQRSAEKFVVVAAWPILTPNIGFNEKATLKIQHVDARNGATEILNQLRQKLSPQGNVVSPRGRALTEEVFGKPLTPIEVVEQPIENDIK